MINRDALNPQDREGLTPQTASEEEAIVNDLTTYSAQNAVNNPFDQREQGTQVAGAGSLLRNLLRSLGKDTAPHTEDIIRGVKQRREDAAAKKLAEEEKAGKQALSGMLGDVTPPQLTGIPGELPAYRETKPPLKDVDIDPEEVLQSQISQKEAGVVPEPRTDRRNLNVRNINSAMDSAKTSEDIARVFEAVGETLDEQHVVRGQAEVAKGAQDIEAIKKTLRPVLSGQQTGLMTDKQLFAARTVLSTQGEEVAKLADAISSGDATDEMLLQYQRKVKQLAATQTWLRGNVRETARALSQQNMIAKSLAGNLHDIDEMLHVGSMTREQVIQQAKTVSANVKAKGPIEGVEPSFMQRVNDNVAMLAEYYKTNILSGPETHLVNMASNAVFNMYENVVVRPIAAAIGSMRGGDDRVYAAEVMPSIVSSFEGLADGVDIFARTLVKDESVFGHAGKAESQNRMMQAAESINNPKARGAAKVAATVQSVPFRLLSAEDDTFKAIAYRQELTAMAVRQAYMEGLEGSAAMKRANELMANPPDQMHEAALGYAKRLTFTETRQSGMLGLFAETAKKAVAKQPALSFLIPFINTPTQLFQRAWDMSALSVVSPRLWGEIKAGGAQRDTAIARMTGGIGLTALAYSLYQAGLLTGAGPENYTTRQQLEKTGWRQNALKVGDTYIPIKRFDPSSGALALVADYFDKSKYASTAEESQEWILMAWATLSEHVLDGTFMTNVADILKMMKGEKSPDAVGARMTTGFIPMSSALRSANKMIDPQQRRVSSDREFESSGYLYRTKQEMKRIIPGMSAQLRPARYWDGSVKVPGQGRVAYAMSPIKIEGDKGVTPSDQALLDNRITVREPEPVISVGRSINKYTFSILDMDNGDGILYDRYLELIGNARREAVVRTIESFDEDTEQGPGTEAELQLRRAMNAGKRVGRMLWIEETTDKINSGEIDITTLNPIAQRMFTAGQEEVAEMLEQEALLKTPGIEFRKGPARGEQGFPPPTQKKAPEPELPDIGF